MTWSAGMLHGWHPMLYNSIIKTLECITIKQNSFNYFHFAHQLVQQHSISAELALQQSFIMLYQFEVISNIKHLPLESGKCYCQHS